MKVRMVAKNLCEMLNDDEMETLRDEEVRYLHALFERESKKAFIVFQLIDWFILFDHYTHQSFSGLHNSTTF